MGAVNNTPRQAFAICGIQSTLRELGLYAGKIDGLFGIGGLEALGDVLGEGVPSPGTYAAKEVILTVQKALLKAGYDPKGVDGAWGKNSQIALDSAVLNFRKAHDLPSYYYAWSAHKALPQGCFVAIENWLKKWGKDPSHVSYLLSCMNFETAGSFLPSKENSTSKALGLIQFMPSKLKEWGVDRTKFAAMSFMEQLPYVFKFFEEYGYIKKCAKLEDYYLSIFYPAAVGRDPNDVIARRGTKLYAQNYKAFDKAGKGYYTVGDIAGSVVERYWMGMAPTNRLKNSSNF